MLRRPRAVFTEDHEIFRHAVRRSVEAELVPRHGARRMAGRGASGA